MLLNCGSGDVLSLNHRQLGLSLWGVCIVLMFDLAAAARSESLSWNRAWGRGSPRAAGEGGQRPWSAAGAGRTRAAQGGCRLLAGVGEGFPVVLSEMATAAGNAPGAQPGWGKPGLHRSRFRSLWVGGRSLLCSRGSPILLGTHREPGRAGAKPGGAGPILLAASW